VHKSHGNCVCSVVRMSANCGHQRPELQALAPVSFTASYLYTSSQQMLGVAVKSRWQSFVPSLFPGL
jgi:hypothetical protein